MKMKRKRIGKKPSRNLPTSKKSAPPVPGSDKSQLMNIGHEVLERQPRKLTPVQIDALGHLTKLRDFSKVADAWRLCQIAYVLERGAPDKTVEGQQWLFKHTMRIDYRRGKEQALAFRAYRKDPKEFFRYKPTAAILLANKPPFERRRLWAKSGNLPKLRALLRGDNVAIKRQATGMESAETLDAGAPDVAPSATELEDAASNTPTKEALSESQGEQHDPARAVARMDGPPRVFLEDGKRVAVAPGMEAEYSGSGVVLWISREGRTLAELEDLTSRAIGKRVRLDVGNVGHSRPAVQGKTRGGSAAQMSII
jgi:hypothetical protein